MLDGVAQISRVPLCCAHYGYTLKKGLSESCHVPSAETCGEYFREGRSRSELPREIAVHSSLDSRSTTQVKNADTSLSPADPWHESDKSCPKFDRGDPSLEQLLEFRGALPNSFAPLTFLLQGFRGNSSCVRYGSSSSMPKNAE